MKLVFTGNNPIEAQVAAGFLQANGIQAEVRRDQLWSVAVEIWATPGALPSVWVPLDEVDKAKQLLKNRSKSVPVKNWVCNGCGETIEGQFDSCWSCGEAK